MHKTHIIFVALLGLAMLISACEKNTISATQADDQISKKVLDEQSCANVLCSQNQQCVAGNCICAQNATSCQGKCIPKNSCCADTDCTRGKFCAEDNHCHERQIECNYNQKWDVQKEECACVLGTKFCEQQKKCIPTTNCCLPSDCTLRRDLCLQTTYVASVCLIDDSTHCKGIPEGQKSIFFAANQTYRITLQKILENGKTALIINENNQSVLFNTSQKLGQNLEINVDKIKSMGGVCKTYPD